MRLELCDGDLKPGQEIRSVHDTKFDMFKEDVQAAIIAVGQATYISNYGGYSVIHPPKPKEVSQVDEVPPFGTPFYRKIAEPQTPDEQPKNEIISHPPHHSHEATSRKTPDGEPLTHVHGFRPHGIRP